MSELEFALALKKVSSIGDIASKTLINTFGTATAVFDADYNQLIAVPGITEAKAKAILAFNQFDAVKAELELLNAAAVQLYYFKHTNYPLRLKAFADAPFLFFGKGNLNLNPNRIIGVVGTRKNSEYGKDFTQNLIKHISHSGCTIVSGLALGIDAIAHQAALDNQLPTIGVLGSGILNVYPQKNLKLADDMCSTGGLISDYFSNDAPFPGNFPKRNRIVAGLCDALVVVETSIKGGAKITAEIANSYNKDVFALPGRPSDFNSYGCNFLIRHNKAILINEPEDLITDLGWDTPVKNTNKQLDFDFNLIEKHADLVAILMQEKRVHIDILLSKLAMDDFSALSIQLLELEFSGVIRQLPGMYYEMR
jgi:DNA processing protein